MKSTAENPWAIQTLLPSGTIAAFTTGVGGNVLSNGTLTDTLATIASGITQYPFTFNMQSHSIAKDRSLSVYLLGAKVTYASITAQTSKFLRTQAKNTSYVGTEETAATDPAAAFSATDTPSPVQTTATSPAQADVVTAVQERAAGSVHKYWVFLDGFSKQILAGDQIRANILGFYWPAKENRPAKIGNQALTIGSQVTVDYLGIYAFEYEGDNTDNAARYGVSESIIDRAAAEAGDYNAKILKNRTILALSLQYNRSTNTPYAHDGNLYGNLYATAYTTLAEAEQAANSGSVKGFNVSKEMLRPLYSDAIAAREEAGSSAYVPLAEFVGNETAQTTDGIKIGEWPVEMGLTAAPKVGDSDENPFYTDMEAEAEDIRASGSDTTSFEDQSVGRESATYREDLALHGYINNDISYVPAYDDRVQALYPENAGEQKEEVPWAYANMVRIGDVLLPIPPLAIQSTKQFKTDNVQTLRAKSSLQKQVGSTRNVLSLDLYFHSLEDINGTESVGYERADGEQIVYAMDGFRPLLAQFKKAPFLPIDNEYINETLQIHNVVLRNLSVQTVEGFPEALKVTLVVEEFDSAPYLMGKTQLGNVLNYPLLRWHYQQLLHQPATYVPWRSYLPKVDYLSNQITFSIVDEAQLQARKDAISQYRSMKTPYEYKQDLLNTDTATGQVNEDLSRIQKALDQYERFLAIVKEKNLLDTYDSYREIPVVAHEGIGYDKLNNWFKPSIGPSGNFNGLDFKETTLGQEIAIALYGESVETGISNRATFVYQGLFSRLTTEPADAAFFTFREITSGVGFLGPIWDAHAPVLYEDSIQADLPGFFQIYLVSQTMQDLFAECKAILDISSGDTKAHEGQAYLIPAGDLGAGKNFLTLMKTKLERSTVNKEMDAYERQYNALAQIINLSEYQMKMVDFPIRNLTPVSLNVALENNLSLVQVEAAETPTMQYFGAQDPQIQLTFRTDEAGVAAMEELMRTIGRYVREYREAMVSGFMGVDNPLVNLFGIQTVVPQAIQYDTLPSQPGVFEIRLTLTAFDKTQRRQEALYGYTGGNPDDQWKDRGLGSYDPALDAMYIHEKMRNMEIYPDLELPLVSELMADIGRLNCKVASLENRTQQVYLDPDFYFSTEHTLRKWLNTFVEGTRGAVTRWSDANGISGESSTKNEKPISFDDNDAFEAAYAAANEEYIDPWLEWAGFGSAETVDKTTETTAGTVLAEPQTAFAENAVEAFLKDKDALNAIPTYAEWKGWNAAGTQKQYDKWVKERTAGNPTTDEVWLYLAKSLINKFDSKLDPDWLVFVSEERDTLTGNNEKSLGTVTCADYYEGNPLGQFTWATPEQIYSSTYKAWKAILGDGGKSEKLKNGSPPTKTGNEFGIGDASEISQANKYVRKHMLFQRAMGYCRSIIAGESGWMQFQEDGSANIYDLNANGIPTKCGIMGARLTEAQSKAQAQKWIWDWKANVSAVVADFVTAYKQATESNYVEIASRPLDWAVCAQAGAALPKAVTDPDHDPKETDSYLGGKVSPDTSAYFAEIMEIFQQECILATTEAAHGIYTINSSINETIYKIYHPLAKTNKTDARYEEMISAATVEIINNNMERWTTEEKFKGMFVDMLQFDHTGRMLRAFPSFSLQIIDEGKWFNNFRTWDNFYGYNALQSIDVYKSRKIAADTAVITMANMYGGLTTKRQDMEYSELNSPSFWSEVFWDNYVDDIPDEELLVARKQLFKTMMLQTGARVHLRMGYGSDARYLPIVFNGTITEMSTGEVVELTCQGDGLELCNTISGNEEDKNKGLFKVIEPSDYICKLLTSKGNWVKDLINDASEGEFFKEGALGIIHFGSTVEAPDGTWIPWSGEYGEAAQNIYSQNGQGTRSQWMKENGSGVGLIDGLFGGILDGIDDKKLTSDYDEDNILIKVYGNTPWDIIQTFALCSTDYVGAVLPFNTRSTLFFGKPSWPVTYAYDYAFHYDAAAKKWTRELLGQHQKTYMQAHTYDSNWNILSNDVRASEEGVYNNVIVNYDGFSAGPFQADNDIRLDRQRTTTVEANLVARWGGIDSGIFQGMTTNYWTAEAQAQKYGHSTVRDYMKDMYKGNYTVIGDATVKPHDICFLNDTSLEMQGIHLVKAVHHSMSLETGFVTSIEPDAYVVTFDSEMLYLPDKVFSTFKNLAVKSAQHLIIGAIAGGLSHVVSRLYADFMDLSAEFLNRFGVPGYLDKVARKGVSFYYRNLGKVIGDPNLVRMADYLQEIRSSSATIDTIIDQMEAIRKTAKASRKAAKAATKADKGAKIFGAVNAALKTDSVKVAAEIVENGDDIVEAYKDIRTASRMASTATNAAKIGKTAIRLGNGLKKAGSLIKTALYSSTFWGIVIDLTLEVCTSGLVEMWTRRKQNAECVKVFPLKYHGQNFTAGMNGHRGGVWGDDPSLGDRWWDNEFGSGDEQADALFMSWFPKVMNLLEGTTEEEAASAETLNKQ